MSDDNELIKKIKQRHKPSAEQLISRYYDEIYVFIYKQIFEKQDAMDITQEVFVRVLKSLSGFDPKKSSFRTWLYRVAASTVTDSRRKSAKRPETVDIDSIPITSEEDFEARLENRDFAGYILELILKEDKLSQEIFRLKLFAEQTMAQIAKTLEIPESTVKSKYYRLLSKLRKELERENL